MEKAYNRLRLKHTEEIFGQKGTASARRMGGITSKMSVNILISKQVHSKLAVIMANLQVQERSSNALFGPETVCFIKKAKNARTDGIIDKDKHRQEGS